MTIAAAAHEGKSIRSIADEYGVDEGTIRKRLGSVKTIKIEAAATAINAARDALEVLPPALQCRAVALADVWQEISRSMAQSAELKAKTDFRLASIANLHASQLDDEAPDPEKIKLIHALTETGNKAAWLPMELLKANKDQLGRNSDAQPVTTIDPTKLSDEALRELIRARS